MLWQCRSQVHPTSAPYSPNSFKPRKLSTVMPLPPFNAEGLFPDGVHPATEDELKERCVDPFTTSRTRQPVFDGLCRYRSHLGGLRLNITQWVNGSFTDETRMDPDDIDLVNFVSANEINAIPEADRPRAAELLNGCGATKSAYSCHTFLEIVFPPGHPFEPVFERQRLYWRKWWATPQDYSKPPVKSPAPHRGSKGIILMTVGSPTAAPTINAKL